MSVRFDNRPDARGFVLRCALFTLAFHVWEHYRQLPGVCLTLAFGRGAGYVSGPRRWELPTAYLAINTKGGSQYRYTTCPFRVGLTWNANEVPYGFRA
jgi:hypothetical protein